MEKYKQQVKKRMVLLYLYNALSLIIIILTSIYSNVVPEGNQNISEMIRGFQFGTYLCLQLFLLKYIIKFQQALKTESALKDLYIEENDERTKFIKNKIGGFGFNFTLAVIAAATVTAGFFNQLIFCTLLGVLIFMALTKGVLKLYYRKKY